MPTDFDTDPFLLNVRNGTIDLPYRGVAAASPRRT